MNTNSAKKGPTNQALADKSAMTSLFQVERWWRERP
jgi:hypothetical protein